MKRTEQVARIAHETNRAYCQSIGDNSQLPWDEAPEWQKASAITRVRFHVHAHASGVTPPASAIHDSWLAQKKTDGWKYGPVKDADKKEHPCFVPYDQLPLEQRIKDFLFGAVVKAFIDAGAEQL